MAVLNSTTSFAGYLKTNYAKEIVNTIPEDLIIQDVAEFTEATRIGEQYQQAVITQLEQGASYGVAGTPITLNTKVAGSIEKAQVNSYQFALAAGIDYETLAKAVAAGKNAYGTAGDQLMRNMVQSARKRLEISLWAGQSANGLGVVASVSTNTITFTDATWCPGYWVGMEGMECKALNAALDTYQDATTSTFSVVSVDIPNKAVTFTTLPSDPLVATDVIFPLSARTESAWNDMIGLVAMAGTTSGDLFNISVTKSVWGPNQYAVGGVLSFSKLQAAMVNAAYKGLMSSCTAYIPVSSWNNLLTEQAAMRRYSGEFDGRVELINGGRAISFQTMCGTLKIVPTIYLQDGNAVVVPDNSLCRVGATDVTFKVPGMNEPLLVHSATTTAIDLRCYYNQTLFCPEPGKLTLLTGITTS